MSPFARVFVLIPAFAACAAAQRDVSLETLIRTSENRIGVYAVVPGTTKELAFSADVPFPAGRLSTFPEIAARIDPIAEGAATRPVDAPGVVEALRPLREPAKADAVKVSPRALVKAAMAARARGALDPEGPAAAIFQSEAVDVFGGSLPALVEVGALQTGDAVAPGVVGFAKTASGEMFVCVMTEDFRSAANATAVLPMIVAACFARLDGAPRPPVVSDDPLPVDASLHEVRRHAHLFPVEAVEPLELARKRGAEQTTAFKLGETARLGVLALPRNRCEVAVEWHVPGRTDARTTRRKWIEGRRTTDLNFDLTFNATGTYSVTLIVDGRVFLERSFFVTGP